ncbi:MAG: molybdopterin molybdotransferase MoeA [Acetatifactor sp.]|nr:molybdopterin molybdotransferase MoeA [Acetatifactor sp.]
MAQDKQESLLEIEDCLAMLLERVSLQEVQEVSLAQACGMVLAETVCSDIDVPPYQKSAMDGYAVCAADLESISESQTAAEDSFVELKVKGRLLAGDYEEIPYEKHTAVRVMTGAFVPEGYDAVVRQEDTDYGEETVKVFAPVKPFQNYCKAGEDIRRGDVVAERGTRLNPVHIGLLAETGRANIRVYRPVRVAILCTGSELARVGEPLGKGKIYNNISYILEAGIRREGLQVSFVELCADEEELLLQKLQEALEAADIVITTGAVSVGEKDIVPAVLESLGAEILFRRARIQPGTPTTASVKDGKLILSLSGNPYAAIVNFEIYFWPLMAKMMGHESFDTVKTTAVLQSPYGKVNRMRRFIRARAEGGNVYLPSAVHASSVIHNMTECNCFIDLEPGRAVQVGDEVRIRYIKGV